MEFLAPLCLFALASVLVPLWLHRRERENPRRREVSSLLYYEPGQRSGRVPRRLRDLALLALRLLLLVAACLAFAQPVLRSRALQALAPAQRLHILVVDTSLSMAAGDRWARALAQVREQIDALGPDDWAQLVRADAHVALQTEPTRDRAVLREALARLAPSERPLTYGRLIGSLEGIAQAGSALIARPGGSPPQSVLHVFSDFQRSAAPLRWIDRLPRTPSALELHPVAEGADANWFIESAGAVALAAGNQRIEAVVRGVATPAAQKTLELRVGSAVVASATSAVPASGNATFVLEVRDLARGEHRAELVLGPPAGDALAADDRRRLVLVERAPAPVLFASGDASRKDALYFATALAAGAPGFELERRAGGDLTAERLDPYPLVVVSDAALGDASAEKLRAHVAAGHAAWLIAGERSAGARAPALAGGRLRSGRRAPRDPARPLGVERAAGSAPELGSREGWRDVHVYRAAELVPEPGDEVLLRASDGSPLLLEYRLGAGKVWILAAPLDPAWTDLPLQPVFVAFVREAARQLSGLAGDARELRAGDVLPLRVGLAEGESSVAPVQVLDPDGARLLTLGETRSARALDLDRLGFFTVQQGGSERSIAVNPDAAESDLRAMDAEELERWRADAAAASATPASARGADAAGAVPGGRPAADEPLRTPLAVGLLWLLVIAVVLEPVAAGLARRARGASSP